ncbi:hypothetical protein EAF04_007796 [Stromatinia cepivora]|nr:hypothetical protein EAF04_007796 [Stromatinia cepivora]
MNRETIRRFFYGSTEKNLIDHTERLEPTYGRVIHETVLLNYPQYRIVPLPGIKLKSRTQPHRKLHNAHTCKLTPLTSLDHFDTLPSTTKHCKDDRAQDRAHQP